jgi:hypothetical protein
MKINPQISLTNFKMALSLRQINGFFSLCLSASLSFSPTKYAFSLFLPNSSSFFQMTWHLLKTNKFFFITWGFLKIEVPKASMWSVSRLPDSMSTRPMWKVQLPKVRVQFYTVNGLKSIAEIYISSINVLSSKNVKNIKIFSVQFSASLKKRNNKYDNFIITLTTC